MRTSTLLVPLVLATGLCAQWSTDPSAPMAVCNAANGQTHVRAVSDGGTGWYVFWNDARTDVDHLSLYGQHIDAAGNGNALWAANGVPGIQIQTYIPTPGLVASTDGAVIATLDGSLGYSAMRMTSAGTPAWPAPVIFCTGDHDPFYADQIQLPDGTGGITTFWATNNGDVYGAHIGRDGGLGDHTGITELNAVNDWCARPLRTSGERGWAAPCVGDDRRHGPPDSGCIRARRRHLCVAARYRPRDAHHALHRAALIARDHGSNSSVAARRPVRTAPSIVAL